MSEYFIVANSFAAPFVSDQSTSFVSGGDPVIALNVFAKSYQHPCGLYAAAAYESAEAYHKDREPLARWICNHERRKSTELKNACIYRDHEPGLFEVDGQLVAVDDPKGGYAEPFK